MYLLLLSALVYGFIRWRTNKIIRRNKKIAEKELMEQKMKSLEQERIIAEQQKQLLENELALKGKDVASMAFDMVAMNNSISEAKETLLEGMRKGTITTKNASKLLLQMKSGDNDLFWNTFQNNFDLIHKKFFRSLREKYPDLTSNDLKVCALLRLNLNTKDIANFTHLTIVVWKAQDTDSERSWAFLPTSRSPISSSSSNKGRIFIVLPSARKR